MSTGLGQEPIYMEIVNKLQDIFMAVGSSAAQIGLPQICVLGSQSSGKSSVLENIVGRDFLPRGTDIITRRPLILQLVHHPASPKTNDVTPQSPEANLENEDEWGEFAHLPGEKFFDFNKIRAEIVKDTELKAGKSAGISATPIGLRIFSPNVLTLTLVDLPGLTKAPVGDSPGYVERQTHDIVLKYISKPGCIILAVTAANTDLANSDGLKLARKVDPEGTRTVGILTKIDLMDQGTDVVDILAGRTIPLRLGYVPVVSRGWRDIEQNKLISAALEHEKTFFETHPSYKIKSQYCGTSFLVRKLTMIFAYNIQATFPDIRARIQAQIQKYNAELQTLGGAMGDTHPGNVVLSAIIEFTNEFRTVIDGNDPSLNGLSGGARISFVFHELFSNDIKSIDPFDQVKDVDIRTILFSSSGSTPSLFVGTQAFEIIVKQQIKRLEKPSVECCQLVYNELIWILAHLLNKLQAFERYPALRERFSAVVIDFLGRAVLPTTKLVTDMVAMQACYIDTTHPDFLNGHKAMAIVNENISRKTSDAVSTMEAPSQIIRPQAALNERETMETEVVKLLIHSYFNIVKREMIHMVPKAISLTLVNHSKENLQRELLQELYKPEVLEDLLKESEFVISRRKEVVSMLTALNKANEIVAAV